MKKRFEWHCIGLLLLCLLPGLTACLSDKAVRAQEFDEAPLFGMVYDFENEPCADALIRVDGEDSVRTDIDGRFVIHELSQGRHHIEVLKDGYEPHSLDFNFLNRTQALYLRVVSANQLLRQAEAAMENLNYSNAVDLLDRVLNIDPENPVALYLRGLYLVQMRRDEEAVLMLEGLIERGHREPAIYLTLADLYEFRLSDRDRARQYLEQYLRLERDPDVQKRLEALE
jgi:tetratricopeptide (TPR) repeat protein